MRQPSKPDKAYTVEVSSKGKGVVCTDPYVYAQNPKDAVVYALKKIGYNVNRDGIHTASDNDIQHMQIIAKVCLLGGTRESVSFYSVSIK